MFMIHMEVGKVRPVSGHGGFGAESGAAGAPAAVPRRSTAGTAPPGLLPEICLLLARKRLAKLLRFSVPQVPHL